MADGPTTINVKIETTVDGYPNPVTDKVQFPVDGLVRVWRELKPAVPDAKCLPETQPVCIMPGCVAQPTFLLVKPLQATARFKKTGVPDTETDPAKIWEAPTTEAITAPVTGGDKGGTVGLWYSTADSPWKSATDNPQWKPLIGGHVFVNGMAEWVTDMVAAGKAEGQPGPLTHLYFKNTGAYVLKRKGKDGKPDETSEPATIKVLILAGYSPTPSK